MSVCTFLAADVQLPEVKPEKVYPIYVNVDEGTIDDGGADDNYSLYLFRDVSTYSEKKYGVCLEWQYFTEGRAKQMIDYIEKVLLDTDSVELWHVWLTDYWEYDERPIMHKTQTTIDKLTTEDIKKIDDAEVWRKDEKNRPFFYCLQIVRE